MIRTHKPQKTLKSISLWAIIVLLAQLHIPASAQTSVPPPYTNPGAVLDWNQRYQPFQMPRYPYGFSPYNYFEYPVARPYYDEMFDMDKPLIEVEEGVFPQPGRVNGLYRYPDGRMILDSDPLD